MMRTWMAAGALAFLIGAGAPEANAGSLSALGPYVKGDGAILWQAGGYSCCRCGGNSAFTFQRGRRNFASTFQRGCRNRAVTVQRGRNNWAETYQVGRGNYSRTVQRSW